MSNVYAVIFWHRDLESVRQRVRAASSVEAERLAREHCAAYFGVSPHSLQYRSVVAEGKGLGNKLTLSGRK